MIFTNENSIFVPKKTKSIKSKKFQQGIKRSKPFASGFDSERSINSTDAPLNFLNKFVDNGDGTFRLPKATHPDSYKFAMSGVLKSALLNEQFISPPPGVVFTTMNRKGSNNNNNVRYSKGAVRYGGSYYDSSEVSEK